MFATIIVSLTAILLAWMARFQKSKYGGLEVAFIILTIFMSIRFNFGNDYPAYLDYFKKIGSYSNFDIQLETTEIGWSLLNKLFQPLGFFGMIIALTVFEYAVIYRLIKKYIPKNWYWLSVFIFTFNNAYMLVSGSMMRQFLAMCIFILAIDFIVKKRWLVSILLVFLASFFHSSALILLPFCFLGYLNLSITRKTAWIWFGLYITLYFLAVEILGKYFFMLIELEQFNQYQYYLGHEKTAKGTGIGVIFNMLIYLVLLLHQRFQSHNLRMIFILFAFSVFFYLFSDIAPLTGRLGYYFSIFSIICYPMMFEKTKNNYLKYSLLIGYISITTKVFLDFFDPAGIWYESFYTYQTIFSQTSWK
ncbi:EpsG family protein [Arenibacter lacus]|uniref:EpsG family protein n=1 Tax=Arenibacter lacus TaxID=2608629 RepID=UPI00123D196B|nr:EpsG family protein [Arenibacter lacus]